MLESAFYVAWARSDRKRLLFFKDIQIAKLFSRGYKAFCLSKYILATSLVISAETVYEMALCTHAVNYCCAKTFHK